MAEKATRRHIATVCGESGQLVFFGQLSIPSTIMAVCSSDPKYTVDPSPNMYSTRSGATTGHTDAFQGIPLLAEDRV